MSNLHVMHWSSNNIKFTSYSDANEVIDELFESFCSRYQVNLETSMRGSDFFLFGSTFVLQMP